MTSTIVLRSPSTSPSSAALDGVGLLRLATGLDPETTAADVVPLVCGLAQAARVRGAAGVTTPLAVLTGERYLRLMLTALAVR